jgi:hypothetical protein
MLVFTESDFAKKRPNEGQRWEFIVRDSWRVRVVRYKDGFLNCELYHLVIEAKSKSFNAKLFLDDSSPLDDLLNHLNDFAEMIKATREEFVEIKL